MTTTIGDETVTEPEAEMLKNPDNDFFCDYSVAYTYVSSAVESHRKSWELVEAVEQHIEGKKPMDQRRLDELGMSWAYNYNYYRARGKIEAAVSAFVDKMSRSLALGYPEFRNTEDDDIKDEVLSFLTDYNTRAIVSSAIGCAFSDMMEVEGEIQSFLNQTEYISYTFGYCPISWPTYDWKGDPIHIKHFAARPGSMITEMNEWVVFKSETSNWLWQKYEEIKDKPTDSDGFVNGWHKEGLEVCLVKIYRGKIEDKDSAGLMRSPDTWAEVLPIYTENPSLLITNSSDISLAKIYYKEVDGSISEVYIPWGYEWKTKAAVQQNGDADSTPKIIYKKSHHVTPKEMISFIRDSGFTVSGEVAKMRGIGRMVTEDSQRYNRTRNSVNNKTLFSGAPWFETNSTQGNEKFKITFSQGFVMMPPGSMIAERQPAFNISENIGLLSFEDREFSDNSQHFDPSVTGKLSSRPTTDEIAVASAEAGRSRNAKDAVKVSDYSRVFLQFIRKMARKPNKNHPNYDGHRKFFDLIIRYLPQYVKEDEDVIKILKTVDSYAISLILGDVQAIQVAIGMAETPFGRNRYRRMLLIAMGHARKEVDMLVPMYQDKYRYIQDDRIAAIENDMFWNTNEVVFQLSDDHIAHFDAHDAKFQKTIQATREGRLDVVAAWKYLENMYGHMDLHVNGLIEDPTLKSKAEEYMGKMKQYANVLKQLAYTAQKQLKEQADAQAAQSAISPKDAADMQREDVKTQSNIARQDYKAKERVRQQDEKQAHDQALADQKAQADIAREAQETAAKVAMDARKQTTL